MYEIQILDSRKRLICLKWADMVSCEEVERCNAELTQVFKQVGSTNIRLVVDATELKLFLPDTKVAIVQQQKLFVPHVSSVAIVAKKALLTNQLKEASKQSGNEKEVYFTDFDKALSFLKES